MNIPPTPAAAQPPRRAQARAAPTKGDMTNLGGGNSRSSMVFDPTFDQPQFTGNTSYLERDYLEADAYMEVNSPQNGRFSPSQYYGGGGGGRGGEIESTHM